MTISFGDRPFHNIFVPCVLPYVKGGYDVDEVALRQFLNFITKDEFVSQGVGVVINSEAGELVYLSREEARRNVEIAVEVCAGRVPVIAGVAGLRPDSMIEIASDAKERGADGLMLLPPMGAVDISVGWNTTRYPEVWVDVALAIDEAVGMPLVMHPVTNMTPEFGPGFPVGGVMMMVRAIENVVAWKMTYNWQGWRIVANELRQFERHIALLASGARYFHEGMASGIMDGTLTASLNYSLERSLDHFRAFQQGDLDQALKIWDGGLRQLQDFVFAESSRLHMRSKIGGWIAGHMPHPFMRPPMPNPMPEECRKIRDLMVAAGCPVIGQEEFEDGLSEVTRVWAKGSAR